jgi:hypothetical protein
MSKTIEIKKIHIRNLIISFVLGFISLYGLEHFGKFHYIPVYNDSKYDSDGRLNTNIEVPNTNSVALITYVSYFKTPTQKNGYEFTILDLIDSESNYNKYSYKSYYYIQSTLKDFKYAIYFSIIIFAITLLFTELKIKLK